MEITPQCYKICLIKTKFRTTVRASTHTEIPLDNNDSSIIESSYCIEDDDLLDNVTSNYMKESDLLLALSVH